MLCRSWNSCAPVKGESLQEPRFGRPRPWLACSPHYRHSHPERATAVGGVGGQAVTSSHLEEQKLNWATRNSGGIVAAPLSLSLSLFRGGFHRKEVCSRLTAL